MASKSNTTRKTSKQVANTRGAKIAASWSNAKVRKARTTRVGCKVGKHTYPSVAAALTDLGYPLWRSIPLRMALKSEGTVKFDGHTFKLVA